MRARSEWYLLPNRKMNECSRIFHHFHFVAENKQQQPIYNPKNETKNALRLSFIQQNIYLQSRSVHQVDTVKIQATFFPCLRKATVVTRISLRYIRRNYFRRWRALTSTPQCIFSNPKTVQRKSDCINKVKIKELQSMLKSFVRDDRIFFSNMLKKN